MDRVVIIAGAGGSIDYFSPPLTTGELTATAVDYSRWSDLITRYHRVANGENSIEPRAVIDLLGKLAPFEEVRNFEDYAEVIDKVASFDFGSPSDTLFHVVVTALHGHLDHYPIHTWTAVPFLLRQLVSERVEEKQSNDRVSDYVARTRILGSFLGHLADTTKLSLFSFNYDDVILDALGTVGNPLEDGFRQEYFSAPDFLKATSVLAFPHGHSRFVLNPKGLKRYASISEANQTRLRNLYVGQEESVYLVSTPPSYSFNTSWPRGEARTAPSTIIPSLRTTSGLQRISYVQEWQS